MKINILLRGNLSKYTNGAKEIPVEVPDNCTAAEALKIVGIDWEQISNFGFVAINNSRVMIFDQLKEGDVLKAYPRISGG